LKIVTLVSGGIDSALMLAKFLEKGHDVYPIHINYGHLAESKEWESCQQVCKKLGIRPYKMDILGLGKLPSGLTMKNVDIYKDAFLPTRNLTLITLAAAYGYTKGANVVAIGLLIDHTFPDQTREFIDKAEISIGAALDTKFHVLTPLIELNKAEVLHLAAKYDLIKITYYCHAGTESPCGKCISCKERMTAESILKQEK